MKSYAKRIADATELPFIIGSHDLNVGVSIGVAELLDSVKDRDEWMRRADVALYAAKNQGRGIARIYDAQMDQVQLRKRRIEPGHSQRVWAQGLFALHYQPIVDVQSGTIHAYEALLRLETPELGKVSPVDFIPVVAEETGLITEIGDWVINQACSDCVRWPSNVCVAVNVSPLQLKSHRILATVTSALARTGAAAQSA